VQNIMTENVICVTQGDSIQRCMELMCTKQFRHLPVVDGKALVGMLSISDVVRALRGAHLDFPPASGTSDPAGPAR
jgi:predicted transcriptional regulator